MTDGTPADSQAYINRIRAEIEAEAETRRRRDPELQRRERELERAWVEVSPPGAAGSQGELLLDRADRLAMIDVDAPLGEKPGIRQVKGAIRKGTFWYLRYVTDQLNALNNVLTRLLRRFDERLSALEEAASLADHGQLLDPVPEAGDAVAGTIRQAIGDPSGTVVVLGCGGGGIVRPIYEAGFTVHGVERDAIEILPGVRDGLDLRAADPITHLETLVAEGCRAVVAARFVEELGPAAAHRFVELALAAVGAGDGVVVVATADPAARDTIERELRAGRGLAPATWAHLFRRAGAETELVAVDDPRIGQLVVARRP